MSSGMESKKVLDKIKKKRITYLISSVKLLGIR